MITDPLMCIDGEWIDRDEDQWVDENPLAEKYRAMIDQLNNEALEAVTSALNHHVWPGEILGPCPSEYDTFSDALWMMADQRCIARRIHTKSNYSNNPRPTDPRIKKILEKYKISSLMIGKNSRVYPSG